MVQSLKSVPIKTPAPKLAERAAITDLSEEEILNEYLRTLIIPNLAKDRNEYKGIVTKILTWDDDDYKVGDIFYNSDSNYQRLSNKIVNNNQNKLLFVHIPFFITNDRINTTEFLHYDTFNKIRVVYKDENFGVEVGDIINVQFPKKGHYDSPSVLSIERGSANFKRKIGKILNVFQEKVPKLKIVRPENGERQFNGERPIPQGYVKAISLLELYKSPRYIKNVLDLSDTDFGDKDKIVTNIKEVRVTEQVIEIFKNSNIPITFPLLSYENQNSDDFLIKVQFELQSEKKIQNFLIEYFDFIKGSNEKYGFSTTFDKDKYIILIDVNLNKIRKTDQKNSSLYLDIERQMVLNKSFVIETIDGADKPDIARKSENK